MRQFVSTTLVVLLARLSIAQNCQPGANGTVCLFTQCVSGICIDGTCFSESIRLNQPCIRSGGVSLGACNSAGQCVDPALVITPAPTATPTLSPTARPTPNPTTAPSVSTDFRLPRPRLCSGLPDNSRCSHDAAPCAAARCIGGVCLISTPAIIVPDDSPCTNCTGAGCEIRTCAAGICEGSTSSCTGHAQGVSCAAGSCVLGLCDGNSVCALGNPLILRSVGSSCTTQLGSFGFCAGNGACVLSASPTTVPTTVNPTTQAPTTQAPTTAGPTVTTAPLSQAPMSVAPTALTSAPTPLLSAIPLVATSGQALVRGLYTVVGVSITDFRGSSLMRHAFETALEGLINNDITTGAATVQLTGIADAVPIGTSLQCDMVFPASSDEVLAVLDSLRSTALVLEALQIALSPNPPLRSVSSAQPTSVVWITAATTASPVIAVSGGVVTSSSSNDNEGAIIAIAVVLVILLVLVVLVAVFFRSNAAKSGDADLTLVNPSFVNFGLVQPSTLHQPEPEKRPKFVALSALELEAACSIGLLPVNIPKNGNSAVVPYNATRVALSQLAGRPQSNYINASFVPGSNALLPQIVAADPISFTADDFWRMIWEQQSSTIVSMSGVSNTEREYLPVDDVTKEFVGCTVREVLVVDDKGFKRRDLTLTEKRTGIEREIHHFSFTDWPAGLEAVPSSTESFLHLRSAVKSASIDDSGPTVIHCQNGSGASAVYAVVNVFLDKYVSIGSANVHREMINFRKCRPSAIISSEAYVFAHKAVVDGVLATPPNPSAGLSSEVTSFLRGFTVPDGLTPFDIGSGGRLILRLDPVVWYSDNAGPTAAHLVVCTDVVFLATPDKRKKNWTLAIPPISRGQLTANLMAENSTGFEIVELSPPTGFFGRRTPVVVYRVHAATPSDAKQWVGHLNGNHLYTPTEQLRGARMVPYPFTDAEVVIDMLDMADPFDADGTEALAGSWSTVPHAMLPDVTLVPRAQGTSASQPLTGGFSVNPAFGYLGEHSPNPHEQAPQQSVVASRLAYTPAYGVNVGSGLGSSSGTYLPSRTSTYIGNDYSDMTMSLTHSPMPTPQREPTPLYPPMSSTPRHRDQPNNSFHGLGTPAFYPTQAQSALDRAYRLLHGANPPERTVMPPSRLRATAPAPAVLPFLNPKPPSTLPFLSWSSKEDEPQQRESIVPIGRKTPEPRSVQTLPESVTVDVKEESEAESPIETAAPSKESDLPTQKLEDHIRRLGEIKSQSMEPEKPLVVVEDKPNSVARAKLLDFASVVVNVEKKAPPKRKLFSMGAVEPTHPTSRKPQVNLHAKAQTEKRRKLKQFSERLAVMFVDADKTDGPQTNYAVPDHQLDFVDVLGYLDQTKLKSMLIAQGTFEKYDVSGNGKLEVEEIFQGADADGNRKITMKEFVEGFGGDMSLITGTAINRPVNGGAHGIEQERKQTAIAKPRLGTASKWKNMFEKLSAEEPETPIARRSPSPRPKSPVTKEEYPSTTASESTTADPPPSTTPPNEPDSIDPDDPPYLYRNIDRSTADRIMAEAGAGEGDFIVRAKNEDRLEYILTVIYKGKPTHHSIAQGPDGALTVNKQPCGTARNVHAVTLYLSESAPSWPVPLKRGIDRKSSSLRDSALPTPVNTASGTENSGDLEPEVSKSDVNQVSGIPEDKEETRHVNETDTLGEDVYAKWGGAKRSNFKRDSPGRVGPDGKMSIKSKAKSFLTGEALNAAAEAEKKAALKSSNNSVEEELKKQQRAARRAHAEALHQKKLEQTRNNK